MSLFAADAPSVATTPAQDLAESTARLASLRFLIIAAARREQTREQLARLRRQYSALIDEIAMSFGVQAAMDAKESVERSVTVPRGWRPAAAPRDEERF